MRRRVAMPGRPNSVQNSMVDPSFVDKLTSWVQIVYTIAVCISLAATVLLVILSQVRTRALLDAENPEAILDNLILVQLFILAVGLVAGLITAVLVARAIVGPLQVLQEAMGRVEKNELNTRIVVTTNDELGYLSERFNSMTDGLRQRERLRELLQIWAMTWINGVSVKRLRSSRISFAVFASIA